MDISLDQAKAFCMIIDCGGYTQAAQKLHKSHSSLIYLVKTFEQQCGFDLFDRSEYRNSPTSAGRRVYAKCLEIILKVDELTALCGQLNQGWEASLKIVFDGILPYEPFLQLYHQFRSEHIPTVIQTYTDFLEGVEKNYDTLNADLMISVIPIENQKLKPILLRPIKMYLVAHKHHELHKKKKKWSTAELASYNFLTIRGSGPKLGLNTSEFEKSASFFLSDFTIKKEAILKQTGFGWLPEHLIEKELRNQLLIPVKWERDNVHRIQPILYTKNNSELNPSTQIIIKSLQRRFHFQRHLNQSSQF